MDDLTCLLAMRASLESSLIRVNLSAAVQWEKLTGAAWWERMKVGWLSVCWMDSKIWAVL